MFKHLADLESDSDPKAEAKLFGHLSDAVKAFNNGTLFGTGPRYFKTYYDASSLEITALETLAKKLCLYSSFSVFGAQGIHAHSDELEQGESYSGIYGFRERLRALAPVIERGYGMIVPTTVSRSHTVHYQWTLDYPDYGDETGSWVESEIEVRPYEHFFPIYDSSEAAQRDNTDRSSCLLRTMHLPYFDRISLNELLRLRDNESDAFVRFQYEIEEQLKQLGATDSEAGLKAVVERVDYEIRRLDEGFRKIRRLRSMQGYNVGLFATTLVAFAFADPEWLRLLTAVVGTGTVNRIVGGVKELAIEGAELRKSDYYVAWRAHHLQKGPKPKHVEPTK